MATFYSNVAAKQTETNAGKLLPVDFGGRVRVIHGSYTLTGTEQAGEGIVLARLPKGARLLPLSNLYGGAGLSGTYTVGDGADADRYGTGTLNSAAATYGLTANVLGDYVTAAEEEVVLALSAVQTAGGVFAFDLFYVVD